MLVGIQNVTILVCHVFIVESPNMYIVSMVVCEIDICVLNQEIEDREKMVKHMWAVYTNSRRVRLPRFWQEAFEAAYEQLTSDVAGDSDAAISEIAKMSLRTIDLEPPPLQSSVGTPC